MKLPQDVIIRELIAVLDAYENPHPYLSNQGQCLDGYSALANFLAIAKKAKAKFEDFYEE